MSTSTRRFTRPEMVSALLERDGTTCKYPNCGRELELSATGQWEVTIDHIEPQSWCRAQGWSEEEIWDLTNLQLLHKKCNARKSNLRYNDDGTLPERPLNRFRYRREKRAQRPEICTSCNAGRDLGPDELCAACGSGPMPHRWPRWAKVTSQECLHDGTFWCWACASGVVDRPAAIEMIIYGGEGGTEFGEMID